MTHVHSCEERLFLDTQAIALSGKYGKEPNRLDFYEGLNTDELRQELVARQIYDIPGSKQGRLQLLKDTLCGVQRVPSLLLLDPTVDPKSSEYNLADYCVIWSCCDHFLHRLPLMTIGTNWNGMRRGVLTPFHRVHDSPFIVVSSKCQVGSRRNYGFSTVAAEESRILQGSDTI